MSAPKPPDPPKESTGRKILRKGLEGVFILLGGLANLDFTKKDKKK